MDTAERQEQEALIDVYLRALSDVPPPSAMAAE
jgi:uncharacterized protein (UPF0335 family)